MPSWLNPLHRVSTTIQNRQQQPPPPPPYHHQPQPPYHHQPQPQPPYHHQPQPQPPYHHHDHHQNHHQPQPPYHHHDHQPIRNPIIDPPSNPSTSLGLNSITPAQIKQTKHDDQHQHQGQHQGQHHPLNSFFNPSSSVIPSSSLSPSYPHPSSSLSPPSHPSLLHPSFGPQSIRPPLGSPPSTAGPPQSFAPDPPPSPSDQLESITQSLALRLQELAAANRDGLLDDDDYRTLRKGLFDQIHPHHQHPLPKSNHQNLILSPPTHSTLDPTLIPSPARLHPLDLDQPHSPTYYSPPLSKSISNLHHQPSSSIHPPESLNLKSIRSARSTRSTSSFLHMIFRRQSRQTLNHPSENASHHLKTRSGSSVAGTDSFVSNLSPSEHASSFGMMSFASSFQPHQTPSSAITISSTSPGVLDRSSSHRSVSIHQASNRLRKIPSNLINPSHSSIRSNSHLYSHDQPSDYRQIEWSSQEIQQEIQELESECAKLLETFDEMEKNLIAKYRTPLRAGPAGPMTKLKELDDIILLNQQINSVRSPPIDTFSPSSSSSSPSQTNHHHPSLSPPPPPPQSSQARPTSFLAPLLNPRSLKPRNRTTHQDLKSTHPRPSMGGLRRIGSGSRSKTNESTMRTNENGILLSSSSSTAATTPTTAMAVTAIDDRTRAGDAQIDLYGLTTDNGSLARPGPLSNHSARPLGLRSDPHQESELETELMRLSNSKLKVQAKYQDRLVYLRAKLKGALIRELPG